MRVSEVNSFSDLRLLYSRQDTDGDWLLEEGEITPDEIEEYDQDGNGVSPTEIIRARELQLPILAPLDRSHIILAEATENPLPDVWQTFSAELEAALDILSVQIEEEFWQLDSHMLDGIVRRLETAEASLRNIPEGIDNINEEERMFLRAYALMLLGSIYESLQNYEGAERIYLRALSALHSYLRLIDTGQGSEEEQDGRTVEYYVNGIELFLLRNSNIPVRARTMLHRLRFGVGKVFIEQGHPRRALRLYQGVINAPEYASLTRAVDSRSAGAVRRLRLMRPEAERASERGLTRRQLDLLARAYLAQGDLYTYYLRDGAAAEESYEDARFLLTDLRDARGRRFMAQSYLGTGDVFRIRYRGRRGNFDRARPQYRLGLAELNGLQGRETKKIKAQLLAAYGTTRISQGHFSEGRRYLLRALAVIEAVPASDYDEDRNLIERRIRNALGDMWANRESRWGGVSAYTEIHFATTTWHGDPQPRYEEYEAGACLNPSRTTRLCLIYGNRRPTVLPAEVSELGSLDRLEADRVHSGGLTFNWNGELDHWTWRFTGLGRLDFHNYSVIQHSFNSDYTWVDQEPGYPRHLPSQTLYNLIIDLQAGLDYRIYLRPETIMLISLDSEVRILEPYGPNPVAEARRVRNREQERATGNDTSHLDELAEIEENSTMVEWNLEPGLGLIVPTWRPSSGFSLSDVMFRVGVAFGEWPLADTEDGRWPAVTVVENEERVMQNVNWTVDSTQVAATLSFQAAMNIGRESRFRILTSLQCEFGRHTLVNAALRTQYHFNAVALELASTLSYYENEAAGNSRLDSGVNFSLLW